MKCKYCGKEFEGYNSQKYCCEHCRLNARRDYKREWIREYRKKYHLCSNWIGTGYLSNHRNSNFDKEIRLIANEFKRLKIKQ